MTIPADPGTAAANNRFGKSFALALTGAAAGCLAVVGAALATGLWVIFLAFPPFIVFLMLAGLVGALLTALLARLSKRRLGATAIMLAAAMLTLVLFAVLPLYFLLHGSGRAGGLLFG